MEAPEKLNNYLKFLGCKTADTICCCLFVVFYLLFVSLMLDPGYQAVIIIAQHCRLKGLSVLFL